MAKQETRLDHQGQFATAYNKNRKIILASQNVCGICGNIVDNSYKYPHPLSATVDHIIPIAKGGHPSDISNLQLSHRWCNRQKSDKLFDLRDKLMAENDHPVENGLPQHFNWREYKAQ